MYHSVVTVADLSLDLSGIEPENVEAFKVAVIEYVEVNIEDAARQAVVSLAGEAANEWRVSHAEELAAQPV